MLSHMKLKLALPVLAAVISTSAFAAGDGYSSLSKDGAVDGNRNAIAISSGSNSSAGLYANYRIRSDDRSNNLVASLSPSNSKARSGSSSTTGDDSSDLEGKGGADSNLRSVSALSQGSDIVSASSIPGQQNSATDTCMGSKSSGIQLPVVGGITIGSSWTDKNCMMIKNARELWNMGYKTAALARMCMDDGNREALESTGTPCPPRRIETASK